MVGIGRLNHVAVAVPDLEAAASFYRDILGAEVSEAKDLPDQGVSTVIVRLVGTACVELITPLGEASPIAAFLERNPKGGMHHLCYEVGDIIAARDDLIAKGFRPIGSGEPSVGAHGKPVLFFHPRDFCGTLVELEEV